MGIDPLQIVLSGVFSQVARRAVDHIFPEGGETSDLLGEVTAVALQGNDGAVIGILTQAQMRSVERFLSDEGTQSALEAWCIAKLALSEDADLEEHLSNTFVYMAKEWNDGRSDSWTSLAQDLWVVATSSLSEPILALRDRLGASRDFSAIASEYRSGLSLLRGTAVVSQHHVRAAARLLANPSRLGTLPNISQDIRNAFRLRFSELEMLHSNEDHRVEDSKLYIDRTLTASKRSDDGSVDRYSYSTRHLTEWGATTRAVVIGNPGAGKTTLVRHIVFELASKEDTYLSPLFVQSRDYAAKAWSQDIPTYVRDVLKADLHLDLKINDITDLLVIGSACVVFDGIDEILDLQQRREFVRRIESFCNTFPYASIVVTSRKLGYSQAKFKAEFSVYELEDFNEAQIEEYITRWFELNDRDPGERSALLRESEAIKDIRSNPLMLSLICTLYRARGYIPQNRRQVYKDCADLLFERWDALRHIPQPYDHRQYGQRLMQELARFFYSTQSAQNGVQEGQLVGVVATFFRDRAAVDPPEDRIRAQQFVDFCADRAWLLSSLGRDSRNVRLFAFTHRTFMEYFAAEAIVRHAKSLEDMADAVLESFGKDPSSIIPDVIVQAADDAYDLGSEKILRKLLLEGAHRTTGNSDQFHALCIRIVNSAPLSRRIAEELPKRIGTWWGAKRVDVTPSSSMALFELYRDPRGRILDAIEQDEDDEIASLAQHLVGRWARFVLLGVSRSLDSAWGDALQQHYEAAAEKYMQHSPPRRIQGESIFRGSVAGGGRSWDLTFIDYMIRLGVVAPGAAFQSGGGKAEPAIGVEAFRNSAVAGSLLHALSTALREQEVDKVANSILHYYSLRMPRRLTPPTATNRGTFLDLADSAVPPDPVGALEARRRLRRYSGGVEVALWLGLVLFELTNRSDTRYHRHIDGIVGILEFRRLCDYRVARERARRRRSIKLLDATEEVFASCGEWTNRWVRGDLSLIADERFG